MDLAGYGPWAVIAGGSEGVGAEFAALLAEAGVNLVLTGRLPAAATRLGCCRAALPETASPGTASRARFSDQGLLRQSPAATAIIRSCLVAMRLISVSVAAS